jgi:hypothetical protein
MLELLEPKWLRIKGSWATRGVFLRVRFIVHVGSLIIYGIIEGNGALWDINHLAAAPDINYFLGCLMEC